MKLEKNLMKQISQRLSIYQQCRMVEWYGRLNSLKVKTIYGGVVQGLPKGTPDYIAIIRNKQDALTVLWIEAKSDRGTLRKEQKDFLKKYREIPGFDILVLQDINPLDWWMERNSKDFIKELPNEL